MKHKTLIITTCSLAILGCGIATLSYKKSEVGAVSPAPLHGGITRMQRTELAVVPAVKEEKVEEKATEKEEIKKIRESLAKIKSTNEELARISTKRERIYQKVKDLKYKDKTTETDDLLDEMSDLDELKLELTQKLIVQMEEVRK